MAMPDAARAVAALNAIPGYVAAFEDAFPESRPAVTYDNMALAIGAFERGLVTPGPFDAFLRGAAALSGEQEHGFRRFVELGCAGCHNGPALGGVRSGSATSPVPTHHDTREAEPRFRARGVE
jgi:cytochrome c peroxidase